MVRRTFASLVLMLLVSGVRSRQHPEQVNKVAPQFSISDGSQSADLSKLKGKVVLLNFWGARCAPCIEELPTLMELHRRMPQLEIVAISMDEDPEAYQHFIAKNHIDLLTIRDPTQKIQTSYGTVQIPETYVIDRQGMLRRKFVSAQNWTSPEIMGYLAKL